MVLQAIRTTLSRNLTNARGWRTNRKIIVFESDDWGSIRMPSKDVFYTLQQEGLKVDVCPYMRNDALASPEDLDLLFQTLTGFSGSNKKNAIFTFNTVVANPVFDKIKDSGFTNYYYEPFTETLKKSKHTQNSFEVWKQGIKEGLISPEFHGREHVNVNNWLNILQQRHPVFLKAFDSGFWGIGPNILANIPFNIQASFDASNQKDIESQKVILKEGLDLFESIFGFQAASFIPNNYVFSSKLYSTLEENGIRYIQGNYYQLHPNLERGKKGKKIRYTGMKSGFRLVNLVRNCFFEPFENPNATQECLNQISNAFYWKKPAVVATHRANYIGSINVKNRDSNIKALNMLLASIVKKWPDVEFMSSSALGNLISHRNDQ
jgi:hypothetical protein